MLRIYLGTVVGNAGNIFSVQQLRLDLDFVCVKYSIDIFQEQCSEMRPSRRGL